MVTYRILRKGMVKFGARSRPQMDTVETFETHTLSAVHDMVDLWLATSAGLTNERRIEVYVKDDDEEAA